MTSDEQGSCKSCKAAIRWGITVNNKRIPLNFQPDPAGSIRLEANGKAVYLPKNTEYTGDRYMPHHETCPSAAEYRKTKDPALKVDFEEPVQRPDPKPAAVDRTGGN